MGSAWRQGGQAAVWSSPRANAAAICKGKQTKGVVDLQLIYVGAGEAGSKGAIFLVWARLRTRVSRCPAVPGGNPEATPTGRDHAHALAMALQLVRMHIRIIIVLCQLAAVELVIPLCGLFFDFSVPAVPMPALVSVDAPVPERTWQSRRRLVVMIKKGGRRGRRKSRIRGAIFIASVRGFAALSWCASAGLF